MTLTAKQERFVEEYLIDLNATQASIRAGYSKRTARSVGHENLTKPDIEAAIREGRARLSEKAEISTLNVLEELAKIGFANMGDYMKQGPDGDSHLDFSKLTRDQAAALSEVIVESDRVKFKLHDKRMALVDIGRILGMFVKQSDINLKNTDGSLRSPTVIERVIVYPGTEGDPGTDDSGDRQI